MKRKEFVEKGLESLVRKKENVRVARAFYDGEGRPFASDSAEYIERRDLLTRKLEKAYDDQLGPYEKRSILQRYVGEPLRWLSRGLYAYGAVGWLADPSGGFLTSLAGSVPGVLADLIDYHSYVKSGQISKGQGRVALLEGLAEKYAPVPIGGAISPLAYLPGMGAIDWIRGRRKFEEKRKKYLQPKYDSAVHSAAYSFLDDVEKEEAVREGKPARIISLKHYRDPAYAEEKVAA